jgi:RNA polymerase sigma-70 factor, ECF subfamily
VEVDTNDEAAVAPRPGPATDRGVDAATDVRLLAEMIAGSQDALASLYDRHHEAVFAAALRVTRDRSVAAEVVQETFLTLWDRAELYDSSRGRLPTWLTTIARNRSVDHLRSAGRRDRASTFSSFGRDDGDDQSVAEWLTTSGALIGAAGADPLPEAALTGKETRASIEQALATLAPQERAVIVLAYDAGLSQSEIAAHLGWPIGTVKTRTRRALANLRGRLDGSADAGHGAAHASAARAVPAWRPSITTGGPAATCSPCP